MAVRLLATRDTKLLYAHTKNGPQGSSRGWGKKWFEKGKDHEKGIVTTTTVHQLKGTKKKRA